MEDCGVPLSGVLQLTYVLALPNTANAANTPYHSRGRTPQKKIIMVAMLGGGILAHSRTKFTKHWHNSTILK